MPWIWLLCPRNLGAAIPAVMFCQKFPFPRTPLPSFPAPDTTCMQETILSSDNNFQFVHCNGSLLAAAGRAPALIVPLSTF